MSLTNTASEPLVQTPSAQACVVEDVLHHTTYLAVQLRNLKRFVSSCSFLGFFYWPTNPIKSKHAAVISILVLYKTLGSF